MDEAEARARIQTDLAALGIEAGDLLLVHTSLSALGRVPGGAETVIQGLLGALGAAGTLLMPALSYAHVHREQTSFDVRTTPTCVGTIPEHFRTRPGSLRSLHPTHSLCANGPLAPVLLGSHHLDTTPCGPHSPFRQLRDRGGKILMLGCGLRPNTSMHGVEELEEPPYLFADTVVYRVIDAQGRAHTQTSRAHGFVGVGQRYDRLAPLLDPGELSQGGVLEATAHLMWAPAVWRRAQAALREDPFFFVEARCA